MFAIFSLVPIFLLFCRPVRILQSWPTTCAQVRLPTTSTAFRLSVNGCSFVGKQMMKKQIGPSPGVFRRMEKRNRFWTIAF